MIQLYRIFNVFRNGHEFVRGKVECGDDIYRADDGLGIDGRCQVLGGCQVLGVGDVVV